ncbi:MAG: ribbon-helix-helix domain-containing protein [Candidatus Methanoculleus thermohydrogenotrophicum]|nr:ribbon-helix-helix domain-containing protein [Candidatus Methanoculleus thermohydrogenotrophicum]
MRFSITMPDDLVEQIDEEADRTGETRADWIRQACTDRLTRPAPEEHQAHQVEVIELRTRTAHQGEDHSGPDSRPGISPGRDCPVTTGDRPTSTRE